VVWAKARGAKSRSARDAIVVVEVQLCGSIGG
jgi:hypothetical protein